MYVNLFNLQFPQFNHINCFLQLLFKIHKLNDQGKTSGQSKGLENRLFPSGGKQTSWSMNR